MTDESFSKVNRIKSPREFERAFKHGVVVADDILILHAIASPQNIESSQNVASPRTTARLGVAISKKAGNAPYRNRWKRLVREAFRRHKSSLPIRDFIIRPKRGVTPSYEAIYRAIPKLVARAEKKLNTLSQPNLGQSSAAKSCSGKSSAAKSSDGKSTLGNSKPSQ